MYGNTAQHAKTTRVEEALKIQFQFAILFGN